jgi:multiple sugar transport system ATP-binding protein
MNFMPCEPIRDNGRLLLRSAPMAFEPSHDLRELLAHRQGGPALVLGVRPVDIHLSWSPAPDAVGSGIVSLVENLGDEQIVAITTGDRSIESVVNGSTPARVGDTVWLSLDRERIHVFDSVTGRSLAA